MPLIILVCTGNTCRSVIAAALLRQSLLDSPGLVEIASAGLAAIPGDKASKHVIELLLSEGIDVKEHSAAALSESAVKRADLILVMTGKQRTQLVERYPDAAGKIYLLKEYAGTARENPDISDPYGGSLEIYRQTLEEIRESIAKITDKLKGAE